MDIVGTPIYYDIDCTYCGAIIRFTLDEIKEPSYGARYINCPVCGERLYTHYNSLGTPCLNANVKMRFKEDEEYIKEKTKDV